MATRAANNPQATLSNSDQSATDLFLVAMPIETYRAISDAASKRNMTFASALSEALNTWLAAPTKSQLLVERKEKTS